MNNKIPDGWKIVKLGEVADFINGRPFKPSEWSKNGLPIIRIQNLTGTSSVINYYDGSYEQEYYVDKGDILLSWSATLDIFKWEKGPALLNQHIFKVKVKKEILSDNYFLYYLKTILQELINKTHGTGMKHITKPELLKQEIRLPPLPTQKKIAAVLEKAEKLREWRTEADGLTDKFLKSTFLEMFGHPLSNNKNTPKEILKNVINIIVPTRDKPKSFTGNIPWVTLPDLTDSIYIGESKYKLSKEEAKPTKTLLFPKNTVILSCAGSLGKIAIAKKEIYTNQQFYGLVCDERIIIPEFLAYQLLFFGEDFFRNIGGTSTLTFFRKEIALNIEIVISDLEKQQKFAHIVQQLEQIREHQTQSRQHIENFFNVLMQRAFRGELEAK